MKLSIFPYIAITTLLLITVAVMSALKLPFNWIFYVAIIGEITLVIMVYRILRDRYSTDKSFKDFYEDHPIDSE